MSIVNMLPFTSVAFYLTCFLYFLLPICVYSSSTLPSPVHCDDQGCTLANYQGVWGDRTPCRASKVVYPATEPELIGAVAEAVKNNVKMKVVTEISHSLSKIACPGGEHGLLISMRDYTPDDILVNKTQMTATVDAGMQLRDFVRRLAEHSLTIPHTPLWDGVSIGGVISTGSHGSGFYMKGGVISEYVSALRMIVPASQEEGYAKVVELTNADAAMKAARISLGVLGVISKVTFEVLPMFKRSLTLDLVDDINLEQQIVGFSKTHTFSSLFWIPSAGKVLLKKEEMVSVETKGEGVNKFPLVQPMYVSQAEAMRAHQENIEKTKDVDSLCKWGEGMALHRMRTGDGFVNSEGGSFETLPVVGFNHRMQTVGGCQKSPPEVGVVATQLATATHNESDWQTCKWDPRINGFFYHHTAISIPLSKTPDFIMDVKKLREVNPDGMCSLNLFGGLHVRFVKRSEAYLGEREDAAMFELVYFRAREKGVPRLNEDVMEELEQMLVMKYEGKPHWGKNREVAFRGVASKVVDMEKFLEVKQFMDPQGLFSSEWSDEILGITANEKKEEIYEDSEDESDDEFCALEGQCICKLDKHCAPDLGYVCQPGLVFYEARVCRYFPELLQQQSHDRQFH